MLAEFAESVQPSESSRLTTANTKTMSPPFSITGMTMTTTTNEENPVEQHAFEADVSRLLHMMVHSVYSDKDVFLRELISNAADACEKLRYEAISHPELAPPSHAASPADTQAERRGPARQRGKLPREP